MEEIKVKYTADVADYKKSLNEATVEVVKLDAANKKTQEDIDKSFQKSTEGVKTLKTQIREAQTAYMQMAAKFGEQSKQANEAALAVGKLKGEFKDFQERISTFDPNKKMQALKDSVNVAASAFQGLIAAQALFGNHSEELQRTLLKVQAAMSLADSLSSLLDAGDAFKNLKGIIMTQIIPALGTLRGALIATGIGAAAVAVGLLVANWDAVSKAVKNFLGIAPSAQDVLVSQTKELEKQNEAIERRNTLDNLRVEAMTGREKERSKLALKLGQDVLKAQQDGIAAELKLNDEKDVKYIQDNVERNKAITKSKQYYFDLQYALTEKYNTDISQLDAKYRKEDKDNLDKSIKEKKDKLKEISDWENKNIEEGNDRIKKESQAESDALDEEYEHRKYNSEQTQLIIGNQIKLIEEQWAKDDEKSEDDKKKNKEKLESAKELAIGLINIGNAVTTVSGANSKEAAIFQKTLALISIGVSTAIAISNAVASAMSPVAPQNVATGGLAGMAKAVSFAALIAGNTAAAIGIINSMDVPESPKVQTPKFKKGGYTGSGGNADADGGFWAMLHPREFVLDERATAAKREEAEALNNSIMDYEDLIYRKYTLPKLLAQKKILMTGNSDVSLINQFDDSNIVRELKKNKPATGEDIARLTKEVVKSTREQRFLKGNFFSR